MVPKDQLLLATPYLKQGIDYTKVKLSPKEAFLVSRVDGKSKLKDIANACSLTPDDAFGTILSLVFKELVVFREYSIEQIKGGPVAPKPAAPPLQPQPPQAAPRPAAPAAAPRPTAPAAAPRPAAKPVDDFDIDGGGWDAMAKPGAPAQPKPAAAPPPPQTQQQPPPAPTPVAQTAPATAQPEPAVAPQPQYAPPPRPAGPPQQRPPPPGGAVRLISPLVQRKEIPEDMSDLKVKGNFTETPYPKLLAQIFKDKDTGILRVRRQQGGPYKDFYFRSGSPLYVGGTYIVEKECLGQLLKMSGKITDYDLGRCLEMMKQTPDMLQGSVLIKMGVINSAILATALKWQIEIKLAEMFTWKPGEGFFELYRAGAFKRQMEFVQLNLAPIILKGIKRGFPYQIAQAAVNANLNNYAVKVMPPPFAVEDFKFQLPETRLWEKIIDGSTTIKDIIGKSQMDPQLVTQYLYAMIVTGMIKLSEKPSGGTEEDKILEDLKARLGLSQAGGHFEALGIHWSSVGHKVAEAWEKIQKDYGPNSKLVKNALNEETKQLAAEIYRLGKVGYEYLIDTARRCEYRKSLHNETKINLSAELLYQQAESQLLIKDDFRNALEALESAAEMLPTNWVVQAAYGCALIKRHYPNKPEFYREGEKVIARATNLGATLEMVHYFAGHAYWAMGRTTQAKAEFETSLKINPSSADARKALRALNK